MWLFCVAWLLIFPGTSGNQCRAAAKPNILLILPPAERLRANADVAPSGSLKVAVRIWGTRDDLSERTWAECDRLIGNSLAAPVTWKGQDTMGHNGRAIVLRVQMKQARLFGFEFD